MSNVESRKVNSHKVECKISAPKQGRYETIRPIKRRKYNWCPEQQLVRKFGLDKYLLAVLLSVLVFGVDSNCQVHRISAGFNFASGAEFNHGETGNPGLTFKTWIAVNKPSTLHVIPSVTAYNRYKLETGYSIMTNYMFQGDIDLQFTFQVDLFFLPISRIRLFIA